MFDKEGGEGTYLGLPECFSGSKVKLLDFIREKLQGRLNGAFAKALSHGGKEILLKSVALSLPVYAMSCFKLPKDVCSKLTSAMTQFWWSTGDNRRKIPWVAWQKMCKPKSEGGLGFHDIAKFNQSLLGKQAWRIWNNPTSLLAQILKGRYFCNTSFLESVTGSRPSYAWRSIMYGRELLKKGLLQSVGNGANTKVWTDNWIFDQLPRPPNYRQDAVVDLTLKVDQLIDPMLKQWDITRLRELFTEEEIPLVLNTKFNLQKSDSLVWGLTNNGLYTSRSGYQVLEIAQNIPPPAVPTMSQVEKFVWKKIWKTKTTPKLKHFMWRALSGALAVKDRLCSRNIPVANSCPMCNAAQETVCHMLFTCPYASEVWRMSRIPLPPAGFSQNSTLLNLHFLLSRVAQTREPGDKVYIFPWLLWHIWKARNSLCFEQSRLEPSLILTRASDDYTSWSAVHNPHLAQQPISSQPAFQPGKWSKPPSGVIKCNIGASWINPQRNSGVAWIARNHLGVTEFHSRRSYSLISSSLENDLMSFFWAIESLKNLRVPRVIFQASSVEVRTALLCPFQFPSLLPLISHILNLLNCFEEWSIEHISEAGNQPALDIAISVTNDQRFQSYVARGSPAWLHPLILLEASTL